MLHLQNYFRVFLGTDLNEKKAAVGARYALIVRTYFSVVINAWVEKSAQLSREPEARLRSGGIEVVTILTRDPAVGRGVERRVYRK